MKTPFEETHMGRVKAMQCCTCDDQTSKTETHHILESGKRAGDRVTIPLCRECHQGEKGVHGDKTMLRIAKRTELQLLDDTLAELYG